MSRATSLWILLVVVSFLIGGLTAPLFENKLSFLFGLILGIGAYLMGTQPQASANARRGA
jgi:fucose permease